MATHKAQTKTYAISAPQLYKGAVNACKRAKASTSESDVREHSMAAVLQACTALEGLINELAQLTRKALTFPSNRQLRTFADLLCQAEDAHCPVRLKYQMALASLVGYTFKKDRDPYRDFDLLFSVRDRLMHHRLEGLEDPHKLVDRLHEIGLCDERGADPSAAWFETALTVPTAIWACNAAAKMAAAIRKAFTIATEDLGVETPAKLSAVFVTGFEPVADEEPER